MTIIHENNLSNSDEILLRKFHGKVKVEDIIQSWEYLLGNGMVTQDHKGVINDISSCELFFDQESFSKLLTYLKSIPLLRNLKLAVVCDSPKNIVFPMMAEKEEFELKVKPFSSFQAAVSWIHS